MTENVARRVPEEFTLGAGFEDYIFEQMSRQLADRVLNKILEGECICKYSEKSITESLYSNEIEYRVGVDIQPLVRCKNCKYNGCCMYQDFVKDNSVIKRSLDDFFCPDGKEKDIRDT